VVRIATWGGGGAATAEGLRRAASGGGATTTVFANVTRAPREGRTLYAASGEGAQAVANEARSGQGVRTFVAQFPQALLKGLQDAKLVEGQQTGAARFRQSCDAISVRAWCHRVHSEVLQGAQIDTQVKWCCPVFRDRYDVAGERTIAVIVDRGFDEKPQFYLQARAVAVIDSVSFVAPVPITLATDFAIDFCPWCGVALRKWYRKTAELLIKPGLRIPIE
jgi:hypothetical protein